MQGGLGALCRMRNASRRAWRAWADLQRACTRKPWPVRPATMSQLLANSLASWVRNCALQNASTTSKQSHSSDTVEVWKPEVAMADAPSCPNGTFSMRRTPSRHFRRLNWFGPCANMVTDCRDKKRWALRYKYIMWNTAGHGVNTRSLQRGTCLMDAELYRYRTLATTRSPSGT